MLDVGIERKRRTLTTATTPSPTIGRVNKEWEIEDAENRR